MFESIGRIEQRVLERHDQLEIIVIGAGIGGLGAAIALCLAGHRVTVLEAASKLGEVGAGLQTMPNSSRVLIRWGLADHLEPLATHPTRVNILGWKGDYISGMDFYDATREFDAPFWDYHRADLHGGLLSRSKALGADIRTSSRVDHIGFTADGSVTVMLSHGQILRADLIIGADGVHSRCREILRGKPSPPTATGDLAYRVLLRTDDFGADPDLAGFLHPPQVRYWYGPGAHVVNYPVRGGKQSNMVLCMPDDMPADAMTLDGNVEEMRRAFRDWDPRIAKLLTYCTDVQKWKLCHYPHLDVPWSNAAGTLVLLGDAVHAALPYLASGAGMALEDGAVLGLCLSRITKRSSTAERVHALQVYEKCRRPRAETIVERGTMQQKLYHLPDGEQRAERDALMRKYEHSEHADRSDSLDLDGGHETDPLAWRRHGIGTWLMSYDALEDVENRWNDK